MSQCLLTAGYGRLSEGFRVRGFIKGGRESSAVKSNVGAKPVLAACAYFFGWGSNNLSPFLNTPKIAWEGQASRQSRQLSRQRDGSNLYGGVDSQALVGQMGIQMPLWVQRSG